MKRAARKTNNKTRAAVKSLLPKAKIKPNMPTKKEKKAIANPSVFPLLKFS